jgi:hypothetical protein
MSRIIGSRRQLWKTYVDRHVPDRMTYGAMRRTSLPDVPTFHVSASASLVSRTEFEKLH